ncbi:NAD(P)H-hydrate dehydratase [Thalassobaculum litoreum]|uniref:Bifunctional NAD(P)H-hydrate repair enzyme n=1 Tax=Thalassobaculum litoreum DSM 18839 TaxID=1123362 RepID=A0A8G2BEL2_9PROT|nr:NAD(P)H-hydrate dehydratase [Thalassobaculum litoreum]SDF17059.1 NAD(P)H-hydrate epimerase [Thalassobaculum litoreum DSM 18839]
MTLPIDTGPTTRDALLTCEQMAACDRFTIDNGTTGFTLMLRAGQGAARHIRRAFRPGRVLVACGPGNNGGDGFVIARDLREHGWDVTVALLGAVSSLKGDAAEAAAHWDGPMAALSAELVGSADILVDALFGAGLTRPVEGAAAELLARAAGRAASGRLKVAAVDVPSGVHGDTGQVLGTACPADLTVTFHCRKPGHLLQPGAELCGGVRVVDIGIDPAAPAMASPAARVIAPALWQDRLLPAGPADHKYTRGHVLVLGGAMPGAARLAARSARRMGAGLVTVCTPEEAVPLVAGDAPGLIVQDIPYDLGAFVSARKVAAIVVGPGLGTGAYAWRLVEAALACTLPIVLDADVFSLFAGRRLPDGGPAVLTPHGGEFGRLFPKIDVRESGRVAAVSRAAEQCGHTVLLKGPDSTVAAPDGRCALLDGAPATLATGGTGDVLAGAVAALLGRGLPPFEAACAGAWFHREAARRLGGTALLAEDLADAL